MRDSALTRGAAVPVRHFNLSAAGMLAAALISWLTSAASHRSMWCRIAEEQQLCMLRLLSTA